MQSIFYDPFDDDIRDDLWTDEPNNGTIVESGDVLALAIANTVHGNWWQPNVEDAPFAKISPTVSQLIVTTKLNSYTVNNLTSAGLFIGSTTDIPDTAGGYCFSFTRTRNDGGGKNGLVIGDAGKDAPAYVAETTLPIWLRMVISGSGGTKTIDFDYSTDGVNWTTLYTKTGLVWSIIGLHVKNWGAWNAISAPFEFFVMDYHPSIFLAAGQVPLMKLEIYVADAWVNLSALDAKNYVESAGISLGGASMTPNPVAGSWSAMLSDEDGLFHPQHPTSAYKDYLKSGRKARLWIGATYGEVDYYWQRLIGYLDEPRCSAPDYRVAISGGDYMKFLRDTEIRSPDNYWGDSETYASHSSDGLVGSEIYDEGDAMTYPAEGEVNGIGGWVATNCTFASFTEGGGGSTYVGKLTNAFIPPTIENTDVGNAEAGKEYRVKFKHRLIDGDGSRGIQLRISQASGTIKLLSYYPTDEWTEEVFYFVATDDGAIEWLFYVSAGDYTFYLDQFSIKEFTPYWKRYYSLAGLDPASTGPYYVTVDGVPCWQGEKDKGWYYAADAEAGPDPPAHPAEIVYFDINKEVPSGVDVVIYYFTHQEPENVVADLLVLASLYVDYAAAIAAMEFTATPDIDHIDKVWFEPGTTRLDAIKKLCERCDYRFHFKYDGTPVFKPKPAAGAASFTFTDPKQISSAVTYQDRNEIRNRIVIKGIKREAPVSREETMPSELKGEASDAISIAAYGERTLTINNHLFQTQASIDAMCAALLAEYKDPKWYSDIEVPFNPVPLGMGDTIAWKERLSPTLDIAREGVIRDIKIDQFNTSYKCVLVLPDFIDNFCGDVINPAWTEEKTDANKTIVLTSTPPCWVTISVAGGINGRWAWGDILSPRLRQVLTATPPCRITTKVRDFTVNDGIFAGLFIGRKVETPHQCNPPRDCFFWGRYRDGTRGDGIAVLCNCLGVYASDYALEALPRWFKIEIDASGDITFWHSTNGIDWLQAKYNSTPYVLSDYYVAGLNVGIFAGNAFRGGTTNAIAAPFEFFRIDKL